MADRKVYQSLSEQLTKVSEITVETVLTGEEAGQKRILDPEEKLLPPDASVYRETLSGKARIVVCGGGHVSLALVRMLKLLDFHVTVIDERPEFANKERFPEADEILCTSFTEALAENDFGGNVYYILVTRGHKYDYDCLSYLMKGRYRYIGMIGSRSKVAACFEKLRAEGYSEEEIAGVHAPIGLKIKAQTPAEIAVSICAEIIQLKNSTPVNTLEDDILKGLQDEKARTMVTVIEKTGSSPRGEGSRMIVCTDGRIYGTIGGGAVEFAAMEEAQTFDGEHGFAIREYDLSNAKAADLGMICGGRVKVLFERLSHTKEDFEQ